MGTVDNEKCPKDAHLKRRQIWKRISASNSLLFTLTTTLAPLREYPLSGAGFIPQGVALQLRYDPTKQEKKEKGKNKKKQPSWESGSQNTQSPDWIWFRPIAQIPDLLPAFPLLQQWTRCTLCFIYICRQVNEAFGTSLAIAPPRVCISQMPR